MRLDGLDGNGSLDTRLASGEWFSNHHDGLTFTVEVDFGKGYVGLVVAAEFEDGPRSGNLAQLSPEQARELAGELRAMADAADPKMEVADD